MLVLSGCSDLCAGNRGSEVAFADMATYGDQITACVRGQGCDRLCSDALQLDARIESCEITSVVRQDATTQDAPIAPSIDLQVVRGVNLRVTYVEQATCDQGVDVTVNDGSGDDGSADDGSPGDGSCDGSCDDGSDDGSSDDCSGDDGSGDDGSGGDGSGDGGGDDGGDDGGDRAPAPTPGSSAGRTPSAATSIHHGHHVHHVHRVGQR